MQYLFVICLLLILSSCSSPENNLFQIEPGKFPDNKITLSEIADDITYIPLDKDNKYPLGVIYTFKIVNGSIFLSAKDIGVLKFNSDGKGVRRIGSKGNGPGEYLHCLSFTVDKRTGNIYVADRDKIKVFSPDGIFVRDIPYGDYIGGRHADHIEVFNSLLFLSDGLNMGNSKNSWVFLDTLGNLVAEKGNSVQKSAPNSFTGSHTYIFKDHVYYCNNFNDTVFSIATDLSYEASYLFEFGEHQPPKEMIKFNSVDEVLSVANNVCRIYTMFETKKYLVMMYYYPGKSAFCFIDKKTKDTFLARKGLDSQGKKGTRPWLINDLDGGLPQTGDFQYYVEKNTEYITTLFTPSDFKLYVSSDEFKNMVPKNPAKKTEIERLANSLQETDNPVLMMIRLKK